MTNQEAAEMIRDDMKLHHDFLSGEYRKALSMAFSALQTQEAKTQLSAEGTTSDLISRQAAIDRIVWWFGILKQNPDILIDSIKTLPSAHSEIEKRKEESAQNVPKEDLISRKEAIDALKNERSDWNCDYNVPVDHCIDAIYSVPSAQPEIIRCKDCRWRKDQSGSAAWLPCRAIVTPSDFYCCRAER